MIRFATRLMFVCAVTVALATSGFAHRYVVPAAMPDSLATYLAAGGVLDDLCDPSGQRGNAGQTCDACRLVDAVSLPPAAFRPQAGDHLMSCALVVASAPPAIWTVYDPSRRVRAPPVV